MNFAYPELLWMELIAVPLLVLFLFWAWRHRRHLISQFAQSRLLAELTLGASARRQFVRMALLVLAVAALILALARPQWGTSLRENVQRGLDIMVVMDVSRSMLAEDIRPNRLRRAQLAALDLMRRARTDRLGLVAFAGTGYIQCPLTFDSSAFRQSVGAMDTGIIPYRGSNLAAGIEAALNAYSDKAGPNRALVLLTDGEDHDNRAMEAAEQAADSGLHLFTIGLGTREGGLIPDPDSPNGSAYLKDDRGNVVRSRLNESLLLKIATRGGGFYLPFQGTGTMEQLYDQGLAPLPDRRLASRRIAEANEQFYGPVILAILLLLAETFLPDRKPVLRNEAIMPAHSANSKKAVLLLCLCLFLMAPQIHASPATAWEDYRQGRYQSAYQAFQQLLEEHPDDPRFHFNAGAAAFQAGNFNRAEKHFQTVTAFPNLPLQQQAYYNLGNTLYRKGEQAADRRQQVDLWQEAIHHYEAALKLNPDDRDAQYNRRLVSKKLETLQQQQRQPKRKQPDDPARENPDSASPSQPSPKPPPDSAQSEEPDAPSDQGGARTKTDPQSDQASPQPEPESGSSESSERSPRGDSQGRQSSEDGAPARLTRQEALRLLDAQLDEEKMMLFRQPEAPPPADASASKDW